MSTLFVQTISAFCVTLISIVILAPLALRVGLVDEPSERKIHGRNVPLVGGIALLVSFLTGAIIWSEDAGFFLQINGNNAIVVLLSSSFFLVCTGILDDKFRLGVFLRVLSEIIVALFLIEALDLRLIELGNLLGTGTILMSPAISYCFTVLAIVGLINAFNMLDGIDGLLAMLVITTLLGFHIFTSTSPGLFSLYLMSSLAGFLVCNLSLTRLTPKCFLGDAGSKLLGFIVVCLLLSAASEQVGGEKLIKPATALYLVAVPLFDMVFTISRRVFRKLSAFKADRSHIHHLLLDLGYSDRRAMVLILSLNLAIVSLGLILHRLSAPEYYQMGIFIGCFLFYSLITSQAWLIVKKINDCGNHEEAKLNTQPQPLTKKSLLASAEKVEIFKRKK
ncbi:undecaprenyl/decaprenyl-phosphate alpha-N-acetylglucosaminyl 1-phosphate transferase [Luminiphilus sp.]|nr:undecaprenyl/decaprenyl-phosphate alpha-N-acetylglucosaminyl 1-phosphate transferase [Luminiphilus sp.]